MSIPNRIADIDASWLNEVLPDDVGEVARVRSEPIGVGVGILGEVGRLHLTYAPGSHGPSSLVAKCQSPFPENVMLCQLMGFYDREVRFYQSLGASLDIRVPHCFHADIADDGAPFVLLLEEITGARAIDQIEGASRADCEAVIDVGVALHAPFWESDALAALQWLPPMNNPLYRGAREMAQAKMPAFLDRWQGRLPGDALAWAHALTPVYPEMLDWWAAQGPQTFVHTDFRADNFLFGGSSGAAVTTVDFQLATRHVGVWDVANFLGASVTVEDRRAWERDLLTRYHQGLVAAGVPGYEPDRCWRDYRFCLMQQAWAQIAISDVDPGNDRGRALLDAMITRYFQAAADLDGGELLDAVGVPRS